MNRIRIAVHEMAHFPNLTMNRAHLEKLRKTDGGTVKS
jgi:hypothetical protein